MFRNIALALSLVILSVSQAAALDAVGTIRSIDADAGTLVVFAGGQDRNLTAANDLQVLGKDGKPLAGGLKSPELKAGVEVSVTVQPGAGRISLHVLRLGAVAPRAGQGPRRPDPNMPPPRSSTGLKPLTEMSASDNYKGEDGGLYGGGKNEPPAAHAAAAKKITEAIVPLGADGKPSADGKVVLISMSMSNATQEFSTFKRIADADETKSSKLTIVDCAQGGQTMAAWAQPEGRCWTEAMRRLEAAGITAEQVQVIWVKLANAGPQGELNEHGKRLYDDTVKVLHLAKERFPNAKIAYLGSRIYGGYATTRLNPEPYAYEGAFAVRWLLRDQIKGDAALNFDLAKGEVNSPLLLWGPYLWADGTTPRKSDGLIYEREDLAGDGTHPTPAGQRKVAGVILNFFKTDVNAKMWFAEK
jgi:hypothetical protein